MLDSLKLKRSILSKQLVLFTVFFVLKILFYGIIQFLSDSVLSVRCAISIECFDLFIFAGTLFIHRPRNWPEFFSLGLSDISNVSIPFPIPN